MRVLIMATILALSQKCFSQDLAGIWKGHYGYSRSNTAIPISMKIKLNHDGTLSIHSYSLISHPNQKDSIAICPVKVLKHAGSYLIFEEIDSINARNPGLQTFRLKYQKKENIEYLKGTWTTRENKDGEGSGNISLIRTSDN